MLRRCGVVGGQVGGAMAVWCGMVWCSGLSHLPLPPSFHRAELIHRMDAQQLSGLACGPDQLLVPHGPPDCQRSRHPDRRRHRVTGMGWGAAGVATAGSTDATAASAASSIWSPLPSSAVEVSVTGVDVATAGGAGGGSAGQRRAGKKAKMTRNQLKRLKKQRERGA